MIETQRKFDQDFKDGAVRIVKETGRPFVQVSRKLGINTGTPVNWVNMAQQRRRAGNEGLSLFRFDGHRRSGDARHSRMEPWGLDDPVGLFVTQLAAPSAMKLGDGDEVVLWNVATGSQTATTLDPEGGWTDSPARSTPAMGRGRERHPGLAGGRFPALVGVRAHGHRGPSVCLAE
ncbi:transposase [Streptosporangium sp. CA-135522]|uniref:transposase n=1 Tax=Streptosporangium sp. CA-135522 TaxID=3240072 RepID=UPI003D90F07C